MADRKFADEIATGGIGRPKLRIAGRPREGGEERYILLEEPGDPVLMHFSGRLLPHFKRDCPNCRGTDEPKPMWYVGASALGSNELVIVELMSKCFQSAAASARNIPGRPSEGIDLFGDEVEAPASFIGLLVTIRRANSPRSPRTLRCTERKQVRSPWPYRTREELARIWGVPLRPRLFREGGA